MAQDNANGENKPRNTRVDWRERQRKEKFAGQLRFLFRVALLAVMVGLGIVYKDRILSLFKSKEVVQAPAPQPAPAPKKLAPAPAPEPVKRVEPPPPAPTPVPEPPKAAESKPDFDPAEQERAKQLIADGIKAMQKMTADQLHFDFEAGRSRFEEAARLRAERKTHQEAEEWVKRVDQFKQATQHIPISEYGAAETSYRFVSTDGRKMNVLKVRDEGSSVTLCWYPENNPATVGKSRFPVPKDQVVSLEPVSRSQRHEGFRQLLLQLESGSSLTSTEDFYDLVYLSKRLGLGAECVDYLARAYEKTAQVPLGESFRRLVVHRAIERAALLAAANQKGQAQKVLDTLLKTLPGYALAQDEVDVFVVKILNNLKDNYRSTLALVKKESKSAPQTPVKTAPATAKPEPKQPESSAKEMAEAAEGGGEQLGVDSSSVLAKGAASGIVDQANKEYEMGMKFYSEFRKGGDRNANLKKAAEHLGRAVDLYDKALQKEPNNEAIANRQQEANMIRYGCLKYTTL